MDAPTEAPQKGRRKIGRKGLIGIVVGVIVLLLLSTCINRDDDGDDTADAAEENPAPEEDVDDGLIEVPDLVGQAGDEARDTLEDLGLEVAWETDDGVVFNFSNWEVESTDPEPGERVEEESEVTLNLTRPEGYDEDESEGEDTDDEPEAESSGRAPVDPSDYSGMDPWEALEDIVTSRAYAVDASVSDNTFEQDGTRPQVSFDWPGSGNTRLEDHVLDILLVADEVWDPAWAELQFFVSDVTGPLLINIGYSHDAVATVASNYENEDQPIIEAADRDPHVVNEWLHEEFNIRPAR